MILNPLQTEPLFHLGPVAISEPVVVTWVIMALLVGGSALLTRQLRDEPGLTQTALELLVGGIRDQIAEVMPGAAERFLPLLGTLFIYLVVANLSSVVPGVHAPTAHVETAAALEIVVYFAGHYYGIRSQGALAYLRSYTRPNIFMLPLNVVSEITRSFSLTVRLFGNIMSHELVIGIVLTLAGLLVPIPLMALGALIGVVQAYIFAVLAAVFVGGSVGAIEKG